MGQKRAYDVAMGESKENKNPSSPMQSMFEEFRAELDEHHDRRERIIKASRDITAASKKIIFALQRVDKVKQPIPPSVERTTLPLYETITNLFASVATDLQGANTHRYARSISGGIQEYMEALTFQHYLTTQALLPYDSSLQQLSFKPSKHSTSASNGSAASASRTSEESQPQQIHLTPEDYLLGVMDMTGELMRFSITAMATSGNLPPLPPRSAAATSASAFLQQRTALHDLHAIHTLLATLEYHNSPFTGGGGAGFARDVRGKMDVLRTSVQKVERGLYGLVVRGSERRPGSTRAEDLGVDLKIGAPSRDRGERQEDDDDDAG